MTYLDCTINFSPFSILNACFKVKIYISYFCLF
nr:MAG TPA: hypothetical protein [Caudoviricetes sp.]